MSKFDKYLLSQLLALFGFFSLVLVAVYWVNRAVGLFDQLIGDGQSALVFLQFSLLTLPNVIRLVLPISAFVSAVYVANRLMSESELVVMQATGFSAFRLARPVLLFGVIVALMLAALTHWLVPTSRTMLELRSAEISRDASSQFLKSGMFLHPNDGVTLYIRDINARGELLDMFVSDNRDPEAPVVYTSLKGLFLKDSEGQKLLMIDGVMQTLDTVSMRLAVTRFSDFTYSIITANPATGARNRDRSELTTTELLWPTQALEAETGSSAAALRFEGHNRFSQPLLAIAGALIGFASLLLGAFSRFGLWRQVMIGTLLLLVVQTISTVAASMGGTSANGWALAYVAPITGIFIAGAELWLSQRPRRLRKPQRIAEATT